MAKKKKKKKKWDGSDNEVNLEVDLFIVCLVELKILTGLVDIGGLGERKKKGKGKGTVKGERKIWNYEECDFLRRMKKFLCGKIKRFH